MAKKELTEKNKEKKESTIDLNKIEKELDLYLDSKKDELTKDILNKIDEQIEFRVNKRMKEEEKKIIRGKNIKIIARDIIIIILLAVIGYFGYCLYKVDYFNIRTKEPVLPKKEEPIIKEPTIEEPVIKDEHDSEYYIKNYSYLIDNLKIEDQAIFELFSKKWNKENIPNELKLKIAYKNINQNNINISNNMITLNYSDLLDSAKKVFGEDIELKNEMFSYNNTKFMFYNDAYLALKEEESKVDYIIKIANAKEEDKKLIFEVVIAKVKENKLLNISDEVILEDYNNEDILEFKDSLTISNIHFENIDESYIFSNID